MRGHEYIWRLRRERRLKPACIFINDYECHTWVTSEEAQGVYPNVVTNGDFIPALDLRFVRGCIVSACSSQEDRAKALFERLKAFQPSAMVVSHHMTKTTWPGYERDLWIGIWKDGEQNA